MNKYKFTPLQREVIFKGYDNRCFYCETIFSTMGDMQIDHFIERECILPSTSFYLTSWKIKIRSIKVKSVLL